MTREGVAPSRRGGPAVSGLCVCSFHHLAIHEQWTVEGVEPSFAGCKPAVFPLDDTPRERTSVSDRSRTCTASAGGLQPLGLAGAQPTQQTVAWVGVEPTDIHRALKPAALPVCVPRRQYDVRESNPPGLFERQATSPEVERRMSSLRGSGRGGGRTLKGCGPRPRSKRVPSLVGSPFRVGDRTSRPSGKNCLVRLPFRHGSDRGKRTRRESNPQYSCEC